MVGGVGKQYENIAVAAEIEAERMLSAFHLPVPSHPSCPQTLSLPARRRLLDAHGKRSWQSSQQMCHVDFWTRQMLSDP